MPAAAAADARKHFADDERYQLAVFPHGVLNIGYLAFVGTSGATWPLPLAPPRPHSAAPRAPLLVCGPHRCTAAHALSAPARAMGGVSDVGGCWWLLVLVWAVLGVEVC